MSLGISACRKNPWEPKKCLRGRFWTHWFDWKLLKEYLEFVQNLTFFKKISPWFLAKTDQFLKSAFFTCLCPWGSRRLVRLKWKSFLSANNALTKNFLFNSHPDFIFCGLFLCPWEPFRTHWFDWKLLRPRPHVSGYFWIRKFFFPDTASVHTHPANSAANPDIFESALQSGKK